MTGLTSGSFSRLLRKYPRPGLKFRLAARTHIGCVRRENQDFFMVDEEGTFAIVADGMGGHAGGATASRLAAEAAAAELSNHRLPSCDEARDLLSRAFLAANRAIVSEALRKPDLANMGTTMICAIMVEGDQLAIGHVGDSRVYRLRDELDQLTQDHSLLNELIGQGLMSEEEARQHPHLGHILTRSIGGQSRSSPDITRLRLKPGDHFLMASDGLYGVLEPGEVSRIMTSSPSMTTVSERLLRGAIRAGAPDNVTVVVFSIEEEIPASS